MAPTRSLIAVIIALCWAVGARANDSVPPLRPVASAYMLSYGSVRVADTYVTPLEYAGSGVAFRYERSQAMRFNPDRWVSRLAGSLEVDKTDNPARNNSMWGAYIDLSWGMAHRWRLPYSITLGVGPGTSLKLGALYNPRNGNNPVAAKGAWMIDAAGYASWRTKVWKFPVTLRYYTSIPMIGAFFAPEYGELYYEISLGDTDGLAHFGWWGSYFTWENLLTADIHFGGTALRLGYRGYYSSSLANHIVTRDVTHSFVIGISGEWLSLNPRKPFNPNARVISATY